MRIRPLFVVLLLAGPLAISGQPLAAAPPLKTENVILVMNDGVRWEEVFRGAEDLLMSNRPGGVKRPSELKRQFDRPTVEARREALFPFLWKTVARQGQLFGNQDQGSAVHVTNGHNFSYPGYSETLCGFADPRIGTNDKRDNPNRTVIEWLYRKPRFEGRRGRLRRAGTVSPSSSIASVAASISTRLSSRCSKVS